jgi:two-component system, chemotaxis family, chemotaxis protein CheY
MEDRKIIYIIRWMKAEKPLYHFGEFLQTSEGRFLPSPAQIFSSLNILFLLLKNKYSGYKLLLVAMGFDPEEIDQTDKFISLNPFVVSKKYMPKPAGKKLDGTPCRVFLVDESMDDMKKLKQIMLDEHFEIMSMARNPDSAIRFFKSNFSHIDVVLTEVYLKNSNMLDVIRDMKLLKNAIKIVVISATNSKPDVQRLLEMKVDGYFIKPVDREKLVNQLRTICRI